MALEAYNALIARAALQRYPDPPRKTYPPNGGNGLAAQRFKTGGKTDSTRLGIKTVDTIRQRALGVPAQEMLQEAMPELLKIIEEESNHRNMKVRQGWDHQSDMYSMVLHCPCCDRMWRHNTTGAMLGMMRRQSENQHQFAEMWFTREIVPFFLDVCLDECYGLKELQEMAKWLTLKLVDAGAAGLPYAQVIHELIQDRNAPPGDVTEMVRALEFEEEWVEVPGMPGWRLPTLKLPEGHPLRTW